MSKRQATNIGRCLMKYKILRPLAVGLFGGLLLQSTASAVDKKNSAPPRAKVELSRSNPLTVNECKNQGGTVVVDVRCGGAGFACETKRPGAIYGDIIKRVCMKAGD